jgi:hypothetical protein
VDVLIRVPAKGSVEGDAIAIPVEIKLSSNPDARKGLLAQLVDRYMSELGTSHGVFVIVWMIAPRLAKAHRPVWKSISACTAELTDQARGVLSTTKGTAVVAVVIVDASLTTVSEVKRKKEAGAADVRAKPGRGKPRAKKSSQPGGKRAGSGSTRGANKKGIPNTSPRTESTRRRKPSARKGKRAN